jgi:hypothetical protein
LHIAIVLFGSQENLLWVADLDVREEYFRRSENSCRGTVASSEYRITAAGQYW